MVIGCTSRPEAIDTALRRAGRFEREITIGVPNEEARVEIMKILGDILELLERSGTATLGPKLTKAQKYKKSAAKHISRRNVTKVVLLVYFTNILVVCTGW